MESVFQRVSHYRKERTWWLCHLWCTEIPSTGTTPKCSFPNDFCPRKSSIDTLTLTFPSQLAPETASVLFSYKILFQANLVSYFRPTLRHYGGEVCAVHDFAQVQDQIETAYRPNACLSWTYHSTNLRQSSVIRKEKIRRILIIFSFYVWCECGASVMRFPLE